jgi:plasmid maintenance system antidote protein VapI
MINKFRNAYAPDDVTPPGVTLQELLTDKGISNKELADRCNLLENTIIEIIEGRTAITFEIAAQFELVLGVPAQFWNTRELHYRIHLAQQELYMPH